MIHARNVRTVHYDLSPEGRLSAPLRLVEVSDLHMGSVIGTAHVQRVVDAVNASHPDLVVFLGDQFNRTSAVDVVEAEAIFKVLAQIKAPLGAYAVLGNHDPDLKRDHRSGQRRSGDHSRQCGAEGGDPHSGQCLVGRLAVLRQPGNTGCRCPPSGRAYQTSRG